MTQAGDEDVAIAAGLTLDRFGDVQTPFGGLLEPAAEVGRFDCRHCAVGSGQEFGTRARRMAPRWIMLPSAGDQRGRAGCESRGRSFHDTAAQARACHSVAVGGPPGVSAANAAQGGAGSDGRR